MKINKQIIGLGLLFSVVVLWLALRKIYSYENACFPIKVQKSEIAGRGVFASRDIHPGEVVEICPTIVTGDEDIKGILRDYHFSTGSNDPKRDSCFSLGYCALVNHSDNPSCTWAFDSKNKTLVITADRFIKKGEEITHSYGAGYWEFRAGMKK